MKKKKIRRATRAFYAALSYVSPRWNTKLLFLRKFGRLPDLKHPQTLNEKLLKQKLERFGTDPVVRQCADKYRVRDYVDGCGCGGTLNRLLAVYDRPEDIDWDALPERFAVKWNFGCGYNLICTDKQALDTHAAVQQLRAWGREPFWAYYSELQYRHVDKKLLIEEYIGTPDGTLPEEKFRYYMLQDYLYLRDYVKIFAAIIQKADDFEQIRFLSTQLSDTIGETYRTHLPYMQRLGVTDAELEAARPSQDQPADKGGKAAADEGAQEPGPLNGFLIGDYGAADGIEMPVDILGQAVHHNIRAERQRLYDVGRRIGVVDHQLGPGGVGHVRGPPDVEQHGQGVRDDFAIKKTGIRTNGP